MGFHFSRIVGSSSLIALILSGAVAWGEAPAAGKRAVADPQSSPRLQKVFKLPTPDLESGNAAPVIQNSLQPVLRMAMDGYKQVQSNIRDYSCILVRRERVDGRLGPHEFIFAKVRHRMVDGDRTVVPFSVYLKFLKPTSVAGREVLFVEGRNDGEMFARRGGTRFAFVTTKIHPESELAMRGNRYPITEVGIENLLYRLIESAQAAGDSPCEVKYLPKAKINGRMALGIVVTHKVRKEDQPFYQARIFVDDDLQVPLHYESFDWPTDSSNELPLLEQYTYTKLLLNPGFTDADFSEDNPEYHVK